MMENLNTKTGLKGKTVTAAVMTLTAAMVVAMVPISQAFAHQGVTKSDSKQEGINVVRFYTFKGHGNTLRKAQLDAMNGAKCRIRELSSYWMPPVVMYNGTWHNAFLRLKCKEFW